MFKTTFVKKMTKTQHIKTQEAEMQRMADFLSAPIDKKRLQTT